MRAQCIRPPRQPIRNCLPQKIVTSGTRRGYTRNGQLTVFSTNPKAEQELIDEIRQFYQGAVVTGHGLDIF
jgi:hypothetical protein